MVALFIPVASVPFVALCVQNSLQTCLPATLNMQASQNDGLAPKHAFELTTHLPIPILMGPRSV